MDIQNAIENFKRAKEIHLKEFGRDIPAIEMYDIIISTMQELQQYRELEKKGRLLKLPCGVGDTVYWCPTTEILPMQIEYYMVFSTGIEITIRYFGNNKKLKHYSTAVSDKAMGKTLFLTREAAEKALEEMKNDRNRSN